MEREGKEKKEGGEEKEKILEEISQIKISMQLNSYDDIFSDFDPRPYAERMLSDDFLREVKRRYVETKKGEFELRFIIPKEKRKEEDERIIKRRIRDYFRNLARELEAEMVKIKKQGLLLALLGMIMMMIATSIFYFFEKIFFLIFFAVLFEPAGWFSVWVGLDHFFYEAKEKLPEIQFCKKMARAEIIFLA